MYHSWIVSLIAALLVILPSSARAQFSIDWYTIDSGGGISSGGGFEVAGTIGQADAGAHSGGAFTVEGGFWPVADGTGGGCYPDFTGDGTLDLFDFLAYVNAFNAEDQKADCDANDARDLFDFLCFVNAFNAGC